LGGQYADKAEINAKKPRNMAAVQKSRGSQTKKDNKFLTRHDGQQEKDLSGDRPYHIA